MEMIMKIMNLLLPVALMSGGVVFAAEPKVEQPEVDKKQKIRCKSEKMTGSRTKTRRVCMTVQQWEDQADATKKGMDEFGRSAAGGYICKPNPNDQAQGCT